jgi:uncharacterized protein YjbI with pentapeptide repeats
MNFVCALQAYAENVNLSGADMTNAVVDRVDFTKANLSGAKVRVFQVGCFQVLVDVCG